MTLADLPPVLTAAVLALAVTSTHAEESQYEAMGRIAAAFVSGALAMETGTTGRCADIAKKPFDHRVAILAVVNNAPSQARTDLQKILLRGVPEMRSFIEGLRANVLSMTHISAERGFVCGAVFGHGAAQYLIAAEEWRKLTGTRLPLLLTE